MEDKQIVEIKNLKFSYVEERQVLSDVNLCVHKGEYVALIGHNGSGKSTLSKILAGLIKDFDGEVNIFGMTLDKENLIEIRKRIGIVFQNPDNQFVSSTVEEDIAFGLENRCVEHDKMHEEVVYFANQVGMEEFLKASPENLSGGQKQRVAIAGVLAMRPDLIILDEATSMLDPKGKREILELTRKMREENPDLTIISITHDVEEAYEADRVLVLNKGVIMLQGTPEEVFNQEEKLKSIHLGVPFFISLINNLRREGVNVSSDINSLEQLEEWLCA